MSIHHNVSITNASPLNLQDTNGKKRKRDEWDAIELDRRPFSIKDPIDPFARPRSFTPLCLLSGAQLPLAYLDTAQPGSRLFSAHIHAVESAHQFVNETLLLVAQDEREGRLYAIERVKHRTYALCRLGEWVKEDELLARARCVVRVPEPVCKRQALQAAEKGEPWWSRAAVEPPCNTGVLDTTVSLPRLAMQRDMGAPQKATPRVDETTGLQPVNASPTQPDADVPALAATLSPQDTLQELAKHYMEALYLSRTSLAYFTKGPLSRARAAFSAQQGSDMTALVDFLRSSIMTSTAMDKKYRDAIPSLVKEFPEQKCDDSPEQMAKRKKRKKWKSKRDKAGFFIEEQDFVERWWWGAEDEGSAETTEEALRRRLPKIRSRESFLQLILVLEVLALEASVAEQPEPVSTTATTSASAVVEPQDPSCAASGVKKSVQKKKPDLSALLETLLDKLCIWHSLEAHSPTKTRSADGQTHGEETSDELRSFCIEVIVPFYVSRIPQYASIVNKKLGGPSAPTPVKRKVGRPGEPAIRNPPEKKPRQPLARVSTEILNQSKPRPMPSLHRSATDSEIPPLIKREGTETPPLASIPIPPHRRPHQPSRPRASLISQISFNNGKREVDLSAMSQASEAKLRKKADVDSKLREAISALKKPNRSLAVKEMQRSTDDGFAKAVARGKVQRGGKKEVDGVGKEKGKGMGKEGVHVTATPSRHGQRVKATPSRRAADGGELQRSSGITHVTSSSSRHQVGAVHDAPPSTFAIPQTGHRPRHTANNVNVAETPSRGFAKFMPAGLARQAGTGVPTGMLDSPIAQRTTNMAVQQTPSKAVRNTPAWTDDSQDVSETPVRDSGLDVAASRSVHKEVSKSVYDSLGWDEDYEELT